MSQSDKELINLIRSTIGDQAANLVESRFDSARKYMENMDRPEVWKTQFLTDVTTAACLVRHGKQCKGLAERIGDGSSRWRNELFDTGRRIAELEQVSAPDAKDAERWVSVKERLPEIGREMFVVRGFDVIPCEGCRPFTTDAYAVWLEGDKFVRWPHNFPPTHWMLLPLPPLDSTDAGGKS
jgi:hypothetical protein